MTPKAIVERLYYNFYAKLLPIYEKDLEKAVLDCDTLLDVGCGVSSPVKTFSKKIYRVGIDAFEGAIETSRKSKIHDDYVRMNILDIGKEFEPKSFDCVLASDVIEHLTKKDGTSLLDMMEIIARKKVIVFTPNGFLPQGEYGSNPWQVHKSGWTVEEMENRGYKVFGMRGWKPLRGEYASPKFWPKCFWWIVSDVTEIFVKNNPKKAFQIMCIKTKDAQV